MADNITNMTLNLEEIQHRNIAQIAVCALTLLLIIIISMIGNMALFTAILTQPKLKDQLSNMFIFNLCLSDLGNAIFVMIPSLTSLMGDEWLMGAELCDINCAFNYCFIIVSMMTLAGISIDRYVSVMYPLRYSTLMTKTKVKIMLTYIWLQALLFCVIPVAFQWINYDYWEVVCAIDWTRPAAIYYVIVAFIVCFLVPATVMCICYFRIVRTVRKNIKDADVSGAMQPAVVRANKQAAKIINSLLVVVALFFISMTPFCVTKLLKVLEGQEIIPGPLNLLSSWIQFSGSAVNPFIYGIFRKDYRRAFRIIWFKATCRRNMVTNMSSYYTMGESSMQKNIQQRMQVFQVKPAEMATSNA